MNKIFSILFLIGLYGCAASVSTEQYVGEYEKQKSLDEIEITKVDNLKILDVKFNKELEEQYPELGNKRVAFGLNQELANVISYIGRFNLVEGDRDVQLSIINDLKANEAKIEKTKYTAYVTIYDFAVNLRRYQEWESSNNKRNYCWYSS